MSYTGEKLNQISFPLGGIGTGSIGLAGNGALIDWEIFNRPNKETINKYTHFAIKAQYPDGKSVVKVLQGDLTKDYMGKIGNTLFTGFGFGPDGATMCAFPHFKKVRFNAQFPIATLTFEDDNFPAKVILKAFNPFIPLDADNSSIPAAFFDIEIKSFADDVKYTVILSVQNPFGTTTNSKIDNDEYTAIKMIHACVNPADIGYGDITVAVDEKDGIYQEYWYRGVWQDNITVFWRDLCDGNLKNRHFDEASKGDICSVGAEKIINNKQSDNMRFVISWNVPNNFNYWNPCKDENGSDILWKNYYATLFDDSVASAFYAFKNWKDLYSKTDKFSKLLHSSTLDKSVIDAVSSTVSVLKTPTVLRLEDGTFYGWEGLHAYAGSCEGTCTHVWSYAYALCFLFPELERSLRDTEFRYDTDENGRMYFRTSLPLGRGYHYQPPCVDGQMATVIKIYRDWKITGNSEWLKDNWDNIKKILEYAWNENNEYEWDKDKDGVLEGRQHHTLDMELFGPSSWLQGMYLCALKAASEMAKFLGDEEKSKEYSDLFEKGYKWTKDNLFNGKYFFHKIDLENKEIIEHFQCPNYWSDEKEEIKYQIGEGSEIDQMLGQWHSNVCGLGDIFDKKQRKTALGSMLENNYKRSLREFANMWRVFAFNDESGSIMCDYPEGTRKPIIPIPYCEECMTGFEYSFAGLLISEGLIEEGIDVVKAIRDRYDGKKRNPYNEIECGSNYARPMASFALLPIFSGFDFNLPKHHIGFSPIIDGDFKCFWSLGTGWGNFARGKKEYKVTVAYGSLPIESLTLGGCGKVKNVFIDGKNIPFKQNGDNISFEPVTVHKTIKVEI